MKRIFLVPVLAACTASLSGCVVAPAQPVYADYPTQVYAPGPAYVAPAPVVVTGGYYGGYGHYYGRHGHYRHW